MWGLLSIGERHALSCPIGKKLAEQDGMAPRHWVRSLRRRDQQWRPCARPRWRTLSREYMYSPFSFGAFDVQRNGATGSTGQWLLKQRVCKVLLLFVHLLHKMWTNVCLFRGKCRWIVLVTLYVCKNIL